MHLGWAGAFFLESQHHSSTTEYAFSRQRQAPYGAVSCTDAVT